MARVQYGSIITNISGSLGGHTFQENAYGKTVRNKPIPLRPTTEDQLAMRRYFINSQNAWQNLTTLQVNTWNTFASLHPWYSKHNPSSKLSAYAIFMAWQQLRQAANMNIYVDIDFLPWAMPSVTFKIETTGTQLFITFSQALAPLAAQAFTKISGKLKSSQTTNVNGLRFMRYQSTPDPSWEITTAYLNKFGALPAISDNVYVGVSFTYGFAPQMTAEIRQVVSVTAKP